MVSVSTFIILWCTFGIYKDAENQQTQETFCSFGKCFCSYTFIHSHQQHFAKRSHKKCIKYNKMTYLGGRTKWVYAAIYTRQIIRQRASLPQQMLFLFVRSLKKTQTHTYSIHISFDALFAQMGDTYIVHIQKCGGISIICICIWWEEERKEKSLSKIKSCLLLITS